MNNDLNNISAKRYMLIRNILDSSENKKFYNEMDALLLKKYFDNASNVSAIFISPASITSLRMASSVLYRK